MKGGNAQIREAEEAMAAARSLLLDPTPDVLSRCLPHLERACQSIRSLQANLPAPAEERATALKALAELQRRLRRLGILIDRCAEFSIGWASLAATALAGYASNGTPRNAEGRGTLLIEG